jgi:hypothetical protein
MAVKPARVELEQRDLKPDNVRETRGMAKRSPQQREHDQAVAHALALYRHDKLTDEQLDARLLELKQRLENPAKRKPPSSWTTSRRATLARDKHCQKCGTADHLEVHHIKERVYGGTDELDNLIALCETCHAEWTWCQPPVAFDAWLKLPRAAFLVLAFSHDWPTDISAATFKERLLNTIALALFEQRRAKEPPG